MNEVWRESLLRLRDQRYCVREAGDGPPLLLLHGFAGSGASWTPLAPALLSFGLRLVAPDLLGHGASAAPSDPRRYAADEQVADLVALLDSLALERTAVLGYSMGGRLALHLATSVPQRVSTIVLESTSPGIADPTERAARQLADEALARSIEERGLAWFADYWERHPLFATRQRLDESVRTALRARWLTQRPWGLAASLRGFGSGTMPPLWDRLAGLYQPTLVLAGALDERYATIARLMVEHLPQGKLVVLPDAGHAVHLEQPQGFLAAVRAFL
ncbi:MAG: 2-succinyl-6-hydroxy-2,4-cyclohexadiene-1-carboxylate synthase [Thermomicrobium sp.]|nr:2-succinyl-6-hydroxy-2,4-cyclohexadiene-1-carboxylate synthase [Thermomicrobium sp.]